VHCASRIAHHRHQAASTHLDIPPWCQETGHLSFFTPSYLRETCPLRHYCHHSGLSLPTPPRPRTPDDSTIAQQSHSLLSLLDYRILHHVRIYQRQLACCHAFPPAHGGRGPPILALHLGGALLARSVALSYLLSERQAPLSHFGGTGS
jgi:hypothetical protein